MGNGNDKETYNFDNVDEWSKEKVYSWIKSLGIKKIYKKKIHDYLYFKNSIKIKQLTQRIHTCIIENNIDGKKFKILQPYHICKSEHDRNEHCYELSVIFYCQNLMLNELWIGKRKPDNLYIETDTLLPGNNTYIFDDICIKNCILRITNNGILVLKSKNNIIIDNSTINLDGKSIRPFSQTLCSHPDYGYELDRVFIGESGSNGDSCCGGGYGGCGLKLECKTLIIRNKSLISVNGGDPLHDCVWWCLSGGGGSCLLICRELIMETASKIVANKQRCYYSRYSKNKPRIVVDIKCHHVQFIELIIYGFMRQYCNRFVVSDICYIVREYYGLPELRIHGIDPPPILAKGTI